MQLRTVGDQGGGVKCIMGNGSADDGAPLHEGKRDDIIRPAKG